MSDTPTEVVEETKTKNGKGKGKAPKTVVEMVSFADKFGFEMLEANKEIDFVSPDDVMEPSFDSRSKPLNKDKDKDWPLFLADVKKNQVQQSLLVTPVKFLDTEANREKKIVGKTALLLVAGRRRLAAAKEAKLKGVPVRLQTHTHQTMMESCYGENNKRTDTTFWDKALYLREYKTMFDLSQTQVAERLNLSDAHVSQYLSVFDLSEPVQKMVAQSKLDYEKARHLKKITDEDSQEQLAKEAIEGKWTGEDLRLEVDKHLAKVEAKAKAAANKDKNKKAGKKAAEEGGDEGDDTEEETPAYERSALSPLKKSSLHAWLELADKKLKKLLAAEIETPDVSTLTEGQKHALKLAEEKGRLIGLKQAAGLLAVPKTVLEAT